MNRFLTSLVDAYLSRRMARHEAVAVRANQRRATIHERTLMQENRRLAESLTAARQRHQELEHQVRQLEATRSVNEAELKQLWAVVVRDRERIKAEMAAHARNVAEATG